MLPEITACDLFAGSGSLGLEALSRGALHCTFVEHDRQAVAALRTNIAALGAAQFATIIAANAWTMPPVESGNCPPTLVFLDPPYRDSHDSTGNGAVVRFLSRLARSANQDRVVVIHHESSVHYVPGGHDSWRLLDRRTIGSGAVSFVSA